MPASYLVTLSLPLFSPPPPGDVKGILELSIAATGERNTYTLVGRAAEPVAEGQITIECQARKPAVKQFNVPNIVGTGTEYKVRAWEAGSAGAVCCGSYRYGARRPVRPTR